MNLRLLLPVLPLLASLSAGCASTAPSAPVASTPAAAAAAPAVTAKVREERAAATVDRMAAKDFDGAREWFDGPMGGALSARQLRETWEEAQATFGPYKSKAFSGAMRVQGYIALEFDLTFEKQHAVAQVVFDDEGKIGGLFLKRLAP